MDPRCSTCAGTGFVIRTGSEGIRTASRCGCSREEERERLLRAARIPRRYDHCFLDTFEIHHPSHVTARQIALDWVERWPLVEHGLLFLGQPGTGKTHLVAGMAKELARSKGARVVFREQRELLKEIQATFDTGAEQSESEVLRSVLDAEVLVLDDVGAGRTTAWARDVMHDIIVQRYNDRKPILMTSNHRTGEDEPEARVRAPDDDLTLRDRLGDPLMSRLYEMCRVVVVEGGDYRRGVLHARIHY